MPTSKTFPADTQWAIAATVPVAALEGLAKRLPTWLRGAGSKVVPGRDGFSALLVFGGGAEDGEQLAIDAATTHKTPVYLLDFDDEAPGLKEFRGNRARRRQESPADFLEQRGILAPGHERTPSPVTTVGLVEQISLEEAKAMCPTPKWEVEFLPHPRGVLVTENGAVTLHLARSLGKRAYNARWDRETKAFTCNVYEPGKPVVAFTTGKPSPNWPQVDSVLGETTMEGILRVLGISRDLLVPVERDA